MSEMTEPASVLTERFSTLEPEARNTAIIGAVEEITAKLREFEPSDPVKYDFALFGLGVFEKF